MTFACPSCGSTIVTVDEDQVILIEHLFGENGYESSEILSAHPVGTIRARCIECGFSWELSSAMTDKLGEEIRRTIINADQT